MATSLETVVTELKTIEPDAESVEPLSGGHEAEIFAYRIGNEAQVLRLFPDADANDKAAWEANVMKRLAYEGYPVPMVHAFGCGDASPWPGPFLTMDRVEGRSLGPSFWGPPSPERDMARTTLFELMARLHGLSSQRVLGDIRLKLPEPLEVIESAAPDFAARVVPLLREALGESDQVSILHGDFHANNVLVGPKGAWVIDWSDAWSDDPRHDVAWVRLLARADLEPDGGRADLDRYEAAAGRELGDLGPYEALGAAKILANALAAARGDARGLRSESLRRLRAEPEFFEYLRGVIASRLGVDFPIRL